MSYKFIQMLSTKMKLPVQLNTGKSIGSLLELKKKLKNETYCNVWSKIELKVINVTKDKSGKISSTSR